MERRVRDFVRVKKKKFVKCAVEVGQNDVKSGATIQNSSAGRETADRVAK